MIFIETSRFTELVKTHLSDDEYAAFGKVLIGMDVLRSIASVETTTKHGMQDWPVEEVIINSVVIAG